MGTGNWREEERERKKEGKKARDNGTCYHIAKGGQGKAPAFQKGGPSDMGP